MCNNIQLHEWCKKFKRNNMWQTTSNVLFNLYKNFVQVYWPLVSSESVINARQNSMKCEDVWIIS